MISQWEAAGFPSELSERARKEIAQRFPRIPIEAVDELVRSFVLYRNTHRLMPGEIKAELRRFEERVDALLDAMATLSPDNRSLVDRRVDLDSFRDSLAAMKTAVVQAQSDVPSGHRMHPNRFLVCGLVPILQAAGERVDTRKRGTLVTLVDIILSNVGGRPVEVPQMVKGYLDK